MTNEVQSIEKLATTAQAASFTLLALSTYIFASAIGIDDSHFYIDSDNINLPLTGGKVSVLGFFWFAPVALLTAHFFLVSTILEALDTHSRLARESSDWRTNRPHPSYAVRALALDSEQRRLLSSRRRTADTITFLAAASVICPTTIAILLYVSLKGHHPLLSIFLLACLMASATLSALIFLQYRSSHSQPKVLGRLLRLLISAVASLLLLTLIAGKSGGIGNGTYERIERTLGGLGGNFLTSILQPATVDLARLGIDQRIATDIYEEVFSKFIDIQCGKTSETFEDCQKIFPDWCDKDHDFDWGAPCSLGAIENGEAWERFIESGEAWERFKVDYYSKYAPIDLSGRDLRNADFSESILIRANLEGAQLTGALFENAILDMANFRSSVISNANFKNASLGGADFSGSASDNVKYPDRMMEVKFINSKLSNSSFIESHLVRANFSNSKIQHVDFAKSNLNQSTFETSSIAFSDFWHADLTDSDFRFSKLNSISLADANTRTMDWYGADLGIMFAHSTDLSRLTRLHNPFEYRARPNFDLALRNVVGGDGTPVGADGGYVWSCVKEMSEEFRIAYEYYSGSHVADFAQDDVLWGVVCEAGTEPRRTGCLLATRADSEAWDCNRQDKGCPSLEVCPIGVIEQQ